MCGFLDHRIQPKPIELESFVKNCIPDIVSDGVTFGIFYDNSRKGLAVEGEALKAALEDEVGAVWE